MKNLIYVSHNPITRLQLDLLCSSLRLEEIIHIETRGISQGGKIARSSKRAITIEFPCNTYYNKNELAICMNRIKNIIDTKNQYTLVVPHLYNHLFALLAELKCVKELFYVEEGNLSLGLVKKVDMKQYTYKELVRLKEPSLLMQNIGLLTNDIFENAANQRLSMMPYFENQPFPMHPKYAGTISVSKKAFKGYSNNLKLGKPIYDKEVEDEIGKYTIIYLPNLYCKIPNWIRFEDESVLKTIILKTKALTDDYELGKVVLKPHSSTPRFFVDMVKNSIRGCIEWNDFIERVEDNISIRNIIEAAALPFQYAIFQCFSSALSYTRELSPSTKILYPYAFN